MLQCRVHPGEACLSGLIKSGAGDGPGRCSGAPFDLHSSSSFQAPWLEVLACLNPRAPMGVCRGRGILREKDLGGRSSGCRDGIYLLSLVSMERFQTLMEKRATQ